MSTSALILPEAFFGYFELEMYDEAWAELAALPPQDQAHPGVAAAQLEIHLARQAWRKGAELAEKMGRLYPDFDSFFLHGAFCLHELKQTAAAKKKLLEGPPSLREQAVFHYNLACYHAQLGELTEAQAALQECFARDHHFRAEAKLDPDLEPLRHMKK
jgi:predicted Zn-dependent protease